LGGRVIAFEVENNFTAYGLVGAVLIEPGVIRQWVMSCRLPGDQVDLAVMAWIVARMRTEGVRDIVGRLLRTDVNLPCRQLCIDCRFKSQGYEDWTLARKRIDFPRHIALASLKEGNEQTMIVACGSSSG
jgi:predicted enzyme involved in methoxymalonyl-ACP biosynthesis